MIFPAPARSNPLGRALRPLLILLATWMLALPAARAALTIEITGGGASQTPIAIVPFGGEAILPVRLTAVVGADLQRSGLFRLVDTGGLTSLPTEPDQINYGVWRGRSAEAVVIGSVVPVAGGNYEIRFRVMDAVKQVQLLGLAITARPGQLRLAAHQVADAIYQALTGDPGVFTTKITYVVKRGKRYELQVADADGFNAQTVLASNEPIISPAWSPDGSQLAYVSFEKKKPVVYTQSLLSGKRQVVANFKGSNSAPAWSPDGKRLAVVLTKDGESQIYMINADGSGVQRLSESSGIDTEPSFSPDGQWIIFTSDRGGSPQIYRMPASGGQAERLTFEGSYNVSPSFALDGKSFVFVHRNGGRFQVAVQDLATRQVQVLSDTAFDESPSFAPNGRIILYATEIARRGVLAAVSSDGRVRQRFSEQGGDVREPSWGPLVKDAGN